MPPFQSYDDAIEALALTPEALKEIRQLWKEHFEVDYKWVVVFSDPMLRPEADWYD